MRAALVSEYRKLVSTRLWWVLLLALAGYLGFIAGVMALSFAVAPEEAAPPLEGAALAASVYGLVNAIGYVFPLVIGSLAMTTEFRHQTITQSLPWICLSPSVVSQKLLTAGSKVTAPLKVRSAPVEWSESQIA